jgi:outer membrane cobalamin receptor
MNIKSISLIVILFFATPLSAFADSGQKEKSSKSDKQTLDELLKDDPSVVDPGTYYVGEVVVTGRRIANIEQAGTTTVVDAENIRVHGDKTLNHVLDRIPGVTTYTHTKGHTRVRMRGFDQDKVVVMIDGVPLNDIYATDVDIASVSVLDVSKVVVNRGVSSALYGTDGVAGTINVITQKPTTPFAAATVEYGSFNNTTVNLTHGAPVGDFYYSLGGTIINSDGFKPSARLDGDTRRQWFDKIIRYDLYPVGDPFGTGPMNTFDDVLVPAKNQYLNDDGIWDHCDHAKYFAQAKAGYTFDSRVEVGLSSNFYFFHGQTNTYEPRAYSSFRGNRWKPRYAYFGDEQAQVKKFALRNRAFVWPYTYRFEVAPFIRLRADNFSLKLQAFYLQGGSKQDGYADIEHRYTKGDSLLFRNQDVYDPFHDYKKYSSTGFRLMPSYRFSRKHRLSASLHFRHDGYAGEEQAISASVSPNIHGAMGSSRYPVEDLAAQVLSIGIEDELKLWGRLKLAIGVSYDMQNFDRFKNRDGDEYEERYIVEDDAVIMGTRDSINPVVGIVFDPVKRVLRFRAAGAIKTRFPTLGEYAKVEDNAMDEGLKPEHSYNASGGVELFFFDRAVNLRGDYFVNLLNDRIVKLGSDDPPTNVDQILSQGVETMLGADLGRLGGVLDFSTGVRYTYVHARNRDYSDDSTVNMGEYLQYTPVHEVGLDVLLAFVSGTTFNIWATMFRDQRVYVMDSRPTAIESGYSTDYFGTVRLHDPVFLNARISQKFLKQYEITLSCTNLADDYRADPFNPGPGRMFYLSLHARWE